MLPLRQFELDLLHGLVQLVAKVALNDRNQCLDLLRLKCTYPRALQNLADIVGAQKGKIVPTFQMCVDPRRDRGQNLVERTRLGVRPQGRRYQFADNPCIKSVTGQPHATIPEEVLWPPAAPPHLRAYAQQRKIARTATKIADQDQFRAVKCGLLGGGRGYGLQLEFHRFESRRQEGLAQP